MKDLQAATEKICDLKGSMLALDAFMAALIQVLPHDARLPLQAAYEKEAEALRTVLLSATISEHTIAAAERDIQRMSNILQDPSHAP